MLPVTHCGASDEKHGCVNIGPHAATTMALHLTMHSLPINTVGAILVIARDPRDRPL